MRIKCIQITCLSYYFAFLKRIRLNYTIISDFLTYLNINQTFSITFKKEYTEFRNKGI